ncbi:hypothetical protein RPB_2530 [Rhodopseudomonas palustris HaA2]|uniref:PLD phosphodiesterase domain-containing protein n=1 Tax=Rhodopseudomonas palustris (strain HaA2) TaxID=316058 RepID=Q2IX25_RHOP2|nr:hypothetical protein [Rhodopseudomonas palustris]ABD07235.1 hypothetical protein RPB_2530 [Rhodopseudomonas palustris HaA2]
MNAALGSSLSRSLVAELGDDCAAAAKLAAAITLRRSGSIDEASLPALSRPVLDRISADFVRRGWLTPLVSGWLIGPAALPSEVGAFLEGAAAMRTHDSSKETAIAVVTMPPPPSAIGVALSQTGVAHSSLVPTNDAFLRVAATAIDSFILMTPFLNTEGLRYAVKLFSDTRAQQKRLIVRRAGDATRVVQEHAAELSTIGVEAFDYTVDLGDGFETFHAKVALADSALAYVGSANMTVFARHSMDLGILVEGRSARVIANVIRAVLRVAKPLQI